MAAPRLTEAIRRFRGLFTSRRVRLWGIPPLVAVVLGGLAGVGFAAVIRMPKVDSLDDFRPGLITRLYDTEGELYASFARERRVLIDENDFPELLEKAVLAAEDSNFFQHGGVDAVGVARAVVKNFLEGRRAAGGSTITMQLARQLFLSREKKWRRKIEEAFLAVELEKNYSKQQILALYCNLIFLGHGNYGMESAARDFFGKSVHELSLTEAATLAGIPQRPSAYSPHRRPDLVVERRNYVLRRMFEEGFIDRAEYDAAIVEPLEVRQPRPRALVAPYFAEEVRKYLEAQYGAEAVLDEGLSVQTTLDPSIHPVAERALRAGLVRLDRVKGWRGPVAHRTEEDLESVELASWSALDLSPGVWNRGLVVGRDGRSMSIKLGDQVLPLAPAGVRWTGQKTPAAVLRKGDVAWFVLEEPDDGEGEPHLVLMQEPELEGAALVVESATGAVRAMVGGWDFNRSKFNRSTQALRQVGSAFKPFVYGAALEMGYTPADTLFDGPMAFPPVLDQPPYSPRNYRRKYYGIITLRRALEDSINVTAVKLLDLVGADQAIDFARRAGIESELGPYPSLALGAADLIPMEVAAAYAAIANNGLWVQPHLIASVTDGEGRELERHTPTARKAMDPEIAYVLGRILEGVIDRGTARALKEFDLDIAGKTGTTDIYSDAWFVGFTPRYTMLVWVGHDVKKPIGRNMSGTTAAVPIWREIVAGGLEAGWLQEDERFLPPPGVTLQDVEYFSGLLPGADTELIVEEAFVDGTQPVRFLQPDWERILRLPWYQQRPYYLPKAGERMPEGVQDWTDILQAWEEKEEAAEEQDVGD